MQIEVESGPLAECQCGAIVVGRFEDDGLLPDAIAGLDSALSGSIGSLIGLGDIKGRADEFTVVHTFGKIVAPRVIVAGVGKRGEFSLDKARIATANLGRLLRRHGITSAAIALPGPGIGLPTEALAQALTEGLLLGTYTFNHHKSNEANKRPLDTLKLLCSDASQGEAIRAGVERGRILAEAANFARDMANEPSNYMTPTELASRAREAADTTGMECEILDREDMVELGMGALLGVAKGSHEEPRFIVLSYRGDPQTDQAIGLLGKGVTFDTGGISIKPAQGMEEMKGDMSGGASVIAALKAIAQIKPRINVTGIVPATENMPGGSAIKPGDVLVAMSGKTIEVINTDAEGRLILADAICYARKLELSPLVDVATLTGAISVALGNVALGLMGNNQELIEDLIQAGKQAGEKSWQLPLFDEYREQIKSDVADIKNTGGRLAGSITAAWFLGEFVDNTPWVHLDMAGVDYYDHEKGWIVKGASGIPVRTLVNFVLARASLRAAMPREPVAATGD